MPLLVGSGFSPPACITVTKSATSGDRTHDLKIMRLTRCRLRHCRCLLYGASVLLEPCTFMQPSGITLLSSYLLCCFWLALFSPSACFTVTKSATSEDRTHDLKIMRLTRCWLRHCRCLLYSASVKLLEPCTLMRHSGVTLLSGYILCCFGLALVFRLLYKLPWQNVRIIEDGTHGLKIMRLTRCRLRHCRCLFIVHQWSYWSLVRWCGIPE